VDLARAALAAARASARARGEAAGAGARTGDSSKDGRWRRAAERRDAAARRSGSGPDDRDPQPLAATIDRLLAERGWEAPAAVGGVMGRWDELVGAEMAAHCQPEEFTDGQLVVRTDSTAWATQVRLLAPALARRLNEELGTGTVERIRVMPPSGPSWSRGRLRAPGGRGPRDTYG
jgi:predicted nucleic acid-binding Zn ribbon protein